MAPDELGLVLKIFELVKTDDWVSAIIGAIVALALNSVAFGFHWIFSRTRLLASEHFRVAKNFNGNWYLFHWSLVQVTDHKIRVSRLHIKRHFNGSIEALQNHPKTGNTVYRGEITFDNQNFYTSLKCLNDSDSKSIIFHKIMDINEVNLRYAVGVMSGLTHQRHPYACMVVLTNYPLSETTLKAILGDRQVINITSTTRDHILSLPDEQRKQALCKADVSKFTSALLDI